MEHGPDRMVPVATAGSTVLRADGATKDERAAARERAFPGSPSLIGLRDQGGIAFADYRRALVPRYAFAWLDVGLRYALMIAGFAAICLYSHAAGARALWLVVPAAAWIGFWFASIVLFMHEGAHFLLHPDKATNDRLANTCICWLLGDDIAAYRALHWQHHLHLGDTRDTEVSYHYAPTLRFALETAAGVHAWRVFWNHRNARPEGEDRAREGRAGKAALLRGICVHGAILVVTLWAGLWPAALAWVLAVAVVFPYLSALRQQLEHRSDAASPEVDYARVPHGAVNRMFEKTFLARAFGSAGFRRHLLHHWDPSVSYTRFDELEAFLLRTDFAPAIDEARTTYREAWRRLGTTRPGDQ
ncbi:MAG TPA: fatty acid desaturase [Candidatus Bathyarchaeia archaeon]|nr:fatty acid desaturase [Candidatus Bathyarchaeia archaeon]